MDDNHKKFVEPELTNCPDEFIKQNESMRDEMQKLHELRMETFKRQAADRKRWQRQMTVSWIFLCFSLVFSTFIFTTAYWKNQQLHADIRHQVKKMRESDIQQKITYQRSIEEKLMRSIASVLSVRIVGKEQCKNGIYPSKYEDKTITAKFSLEGAYFTIRPVFEDTIFQEVTKFRSLADSSRVNPCSKEGQEITKELIPLGHKIQIMMLESIQNLENKKDALMNS